MGHRAGHDLRLQHRLPGAPGMSERGLDATTATAFDAQVVYPALLFEGEFSTGTGRWWSGVGTLSWGGYSWLGMGGLVGISAIDETTSVEARGFTVSFGGAKVAKRLKKNAPFFEAAS